MEASLDLNSLEQCIEFFHQSKLYELIDVQTDLEETVNELEGVPHEVVIVGGESLY
jgi:hypothetical protein